MRKAYRSNLLAAASALAIVALCFSLLGKGAADVGADRRVTTQAAAAAAGAKVLPTDPKLRIEPK